MISYTCKEEDNGVVCSGSREIIRIDPLLENVLRFRSSFSNKIFNENWTLITPTQKPFTSIAIDKDKSIIKCGNLVAVVSNDGVVKYYNDRGDILLEELWIDYRVNNANLLKARNYRHVYGDLYEVELYFKARDNEYIYGMGQYAIGYLNLKGCALELAHRNTQISMPFALFVRPDEKLYYGLVWNNPCIGRVEFAKNWTMFSCKATKQIDYLVIYGKTPADVVKNIWSYMENHLYYLNGLLDSGNQN